MSFPGGSLNGVPSREANGIPIIPQSKYQGGDGEGTIQASFHLSSCRSVSDTPLYGREVFQ